MLSINPDFRPQLPPPPKETLFRERHRRVDANTAAIKTLPENTEGNHSGRVPCVLPSENAKRDKTFRPPDPHHETVLPFHCEVPSVRHSRQGDETKARVGMRASDERARIAQRARLGNRHAGLHWGDCISFDTSAETVTISFHGLPESCLFPSQSVRHSPSRTRSMRPKTNARTAATHRITPSLLHPLTHPKQPRAAKTRSSCDAFTCNSPS